MKQFNYTIEEDLIGQRLDKAVTVLHESFSRHEVQQLIKKNNIQVNGRQRKQNYMCKLDDHINIIIKEPKEIVLKPQDLALDIVYEDDAIIVINKPKGMLVHPTHKVKEGTLVNGLLHYTTELSTIGGVQRPGIVHRLDQETSGVLVVAKNDAIHKKLQIQFQEQSAIRIYETLVNGVVTHNAGIIKAPIGRNPNNRMKRTVVETGKQAETHFTVIERFEGYTHMECELKTGRTHQIRVHLNYLNHPVVGDNLYAHKASGLVESQALFAKKLSIKHPTTNEQITFEVEQPAYFKILLQKLRITP